MKVLTKAQVRAAEENAVSSGIFSYLQLMRNAGKRACEIINEKYPVKGKRVTVVCGTGNNGGDGLVIAYELSLLGAEVTVCSPLGGVKTDTAKGCLKLIKGLCVTADIKADCDMLIDAVFGIGLDRPVTGATAALIDKMNACGGIKIAVDLPSGVMCDGGIVTCAFKADLTVTFIALKPCFFLPQSAEFCGEVSVADIGAVPTEYAYKTISPHTPIARPKNSHKGSFGTALIVCGSYGMCGAQILAAKAALRSGAGIAKAVVCDKNYPAFCAAVPEAVTVPVKTAESGAPILNKEDILSCLEGSNALLIGCGLGQSDEAKKLVLGTLEAVKIPTVIDADGINAIAGSINIIEKIKAPVILTPHPGEMARLCHTTVSEIEGNRIGYASRFASEHSCVLVLKGANTIVALPGGEVFFNTTGNPGLATGGSGDVLAGITVSLLAQGFSAAHAARSAVWLHGTAADNAALHISQSALLPGDIIRELKRLSV